MHSRLWPAQVFTGIEYSEDAPRAIKTLASTPATLVFERHSTMLTSQSVFNVTELFNMSASADGVTLNLVIKCDVPPLHNKFTLSRVRHTAPTTSSEAVHAHTTAAIAAAASGTATEIGGASIELRCVAPWRAGEHVVLLQLTDAWELTDGGLHDNVLAISLQGLANRDRRPCTSNTHQIGRMDTRRACGSGWRRRARCPIPLLARLPTH